MTRLDPLRPIWARACAVWRDIAGIWGEPPALISGAQDRLNRALLGRWLRALEALVRRLLLTEALALIASGKIEASAPAPRRRLTPPSAADRLGLRFTMFVVRRERAHAPRRNAEPHFRTAFSSRHAALRLAALGGRLAEPESHIVRLARRLLRRPQRDDLAACLDVYPPPPEAWTTGDHACGPAALDLEPYLEAELARWDGG